MIKISKLQKKKLWFLYLYVYALLTLFIFIFYVKKANVIAVNY